MFGAGVVAAIERLQRSIEGHNEYMTGTTINKEYYLQKVYREGVSTVEKHNIQPLECVTEESMPTLAEYKTEVVKKSVFAYYLLRKKTIYITRNKYISNKTKSIEYKHEPQRIEIPENEFMDSKLGVLYEEDIDEIRKYVEMAVLPCQPLGV